jgi:hypothetical protein
MAAIFALANLLPDCSYAVSDVEPHAERVKYALATPLLATAMNCRRSIIVQPSVFVFNSPKMDRMSEQVGPQPRRVLATS